MMKANVAFNDAVDSLMKRYGKYGVDRRTIAGLLKDGMVEQGFSMMTAYNGIRMSLASTFGEHETFSIEDVMDMTGETREEVIMRIEEMREEVAASGGNPDDYATEVGKLDTYYSNGTAGGTLTEIDEMISLIIGLSRDAGYDQKYLIRCAQGIYDQFGVPIEKRSLIKIVSAKIK